MNVLQGEVALVTGASRGIGRSIALALGSAGATVIGTATSAAGAESIGSAFAEAGINGRGLVLDVASDEAVDAAVAGIHAQEGAVTVLVNNAGITRDGLLLRMKREDWDQVLDTDLTSLYRTSRACLRGMMKARKGRIVNIGSVVGLMGNPGQTNYCAAKAGLVGCSVVGLMGNPGQTNYCAAKAGLVGFTRALAREVGSRGITVNAVAPGFIATDMTAALSAEQRGALEQQIPLARLGVPEDIAAAVLFLCSAGAGYVTGEVINVNGGMYMA